jgi:uncharacterized caspase-like protein
VEGRRSALILASYDYEDPGLRMLRAPARDAEALARVLQDPEIGNFEVRTVLNQPAHVVRLAVEELFADRKPDELLVLHFSGHGVKDDSASCTSPPPTRGCCGWSRPRCRPRSSTGR